MGVAAYWRGSRAISRGMALARGELDPDRRYSPTPRPAGYGSKAAARALDYARRQLRGARRYGIWTDTPADRIALVAAVMERARVGEETAKAAVDIALREG